MKTSWHIFWPILEQCDVSTASPPRASIKCAANFKDLIRPGHNSIFMYLERYSSSISNDSKWNFLNGIFFGAAQLLIYNRFSRSWLGRQPNQTLQSQMVFDDHHFFYFIHLGVTSLMNEIMYIRRNLKIKPSFFKKVNIRKLNLISAQLTILELVH